MQAQGSIFDGDGLVTAQQKSDESKDRQEKGWHVLRLFGPNPFQVNLLRADAIMANDTIQVLLDFPSGGDGSQDTHLHLARLDVVVHTEEVSGIVFLFNSGQAR